MIYSNGDIYEGQFKENSIWGQGIFTWKDGRKYEGEFVNNKMEGKGCFTWPKPEQNVYIGKYRNIL